MLKKNADGTYDFEVLVTVRENHMGDLEIKDSSGHDAYVQGPDAYQETLQFLRFIDGDTEALEHGWPCICGCNDELWSCLIGEEY
jgi:hypothetical protein